MKILVDMPDDWSFKMCMDCNSRFLSPCGEKKCPLSKANPVQECDIHKIGIHGGKAIMLTGKAATGAMKPVKLWYTEK